MVWVLSQSNPQVEVQPVALAAGAGEYTLHASVIYEGPDPAAMMPDPAWVVEVWLDDKTPLTPRGSSAGYQPDRVEITAGYDPLPQGRTVARVLVRNEAAGTWSITLPAQDSDRAAEA